MVSLENIEEINQTLRTEPKMGSVRVDPKTDHIFLENIANIMTLKDVMSLQEEAIEKGDIPENGILYKDNHNNIRIGAIVYPEKHDLHDSIEVIEQDIVGAVAEMTLEEIQVLNQKLDQLFTMDEEMEDTTSIIAPSENPISEISNIAEQEFTVTAVDTQQNPIYEYENIENEPVMPQYAIFNTQQNVDFMARGDFMAKGEPSVGPKFSQYDNPYETGWGRGSENYGIDDSVGYRMG